MNTASATHGYGRWIAAAFFFAVLLITAGCGDDSDQANPLTPVYLDDPHTGVWLDWYAGTVAGGYAPELIWEDLLTYSGPSRRERYLYCYVEISASNRVVIWITPVNTFGYPASDRGSVGGAYVEVVKGYPVRVLLNEVLEPGHRQLIWDGRDEKGNRAPAGAYRLYTVVGDRADCMDLYLYRDGNGCWFSEPYIRVGW